MSFMHRLNGEKDIIALCEAFDAEYKSGLKSTPNEINEAEDKAALGDDEFNPDDLFDTVDLPEDDAPASTSSFTSDDISLTHEEKEEIKSAISAILDEIQNKESISEPALEMIVNEVANDTSYLSEAEDANLDGAVEKEGYRVAKAEAIKKFINELLGVTIADEGQLPEDIDNLEGAPGEESLETPAEESLEGEGGEGAPVEEEDETKPLNEGIEGQSEEEKEGQSEEESEKAPVTEGACMECGEDDVVEVDPADTIEIVDDNDPRVTPMADEFPGEDPLAGAGGGLELGGPVGGPVEAEVSDDTPLTVGALKDLFGRMLAESVDGGEKSFADLWKNLAGNAVSLSKPSTKGVQKTKAPTSKTPEGTTYTTPTDESGNDNTLSNPSTKGEQKTKSPTSKVPEGTQYTTPKTTKESGPSHSKPEIKEEESRKLAAFNEANSGKKAVSFLAEAVAAIKLAKQSLN